MAIATHLKKNLWLVGIVSLLSAFTYKFPLPFINQSFYQILALYSPDFFHGAVWTLFTYPFTIPLNHSLTVYDIYQFVFDLSLIGFLSYQILKKVKPSLFYLFFYGSSLFTGIILLAISYIIPFSFELTGLRPIFFALLIAWTELYNSNNSFSSWSISTKTITFFTIALTLLTDIANASWIDLGAVTIALAYSYSLSKILSLKPCSTVNKVILEDAFGNPISREAGSSKIHSIYQGKQYQRMIWWLRTLKRMFFTLLNRK